MRIRTSILVAALALATLAPSVASADTLADYNQNNAALEQLLVERQAAEAGLNRWVGAEQQSLVQLASTEAKLHGLLIERADLSAREPALATHAAEVETSLSALEPRRAALTKRVDAFEMWLYGDAAAPAANNVRGYNAARASLDALAQEADSLNGALQGTHDEQQVVVQELGRANTEITWWQGQAETVASQVGQARERALRFSGRLGEIQKQGDELAAALRAEFEALQAAGHPVGVAKIAAIGPEPIAEPVVWPATTIGYALPAGRTDASLVAAPPLFVTKERLLATGVVGDLGAWMAPLKGTVTTPFGDGTPYQAAHYAVDLGARLYSPVVAAADGVVEYAGLAASDNRLASYGLAVTIRHNEHTTTLYAHLDDRANGLAVHAGDSVVKGQVIGYVGLTGYSTGPHLHFEVRIDNQPIDPALLVGQALTP